MFILYVKCKNINKFRGNGENRHETETPLSVTIIIVIK